MSYCTASDVASVNKARVMGQGQNPTASDVTTYINLAAGEIDAILVNKGYSVPVNAASWPEAGAFLQSVNVKGAVAMSETAQPTNPDARDKAKAAYDAALKMLSDAKFTLNADLDVQRSEPRGPWVTFTPDGRVYDPMFNQDGRDGISSGQGNNPQDPYFSRGQRF